MNERGPLANSKPRQRSGSCRARGFPTRLGAFPRCSGRPADLWRPSYSAIDLARLRLQNIGGRFHLRVIRVEGVAERAARQRDAGRVDLDGGVDVALASGDSPGAKLLDLVEGSAFLQINAQVDARFGCRPRVRPRVRRWVRRLGDVSSVRSAGHVEDGAVGLQEARRHGAWSHRRSARWRRRAPPTHLVRGTPLGAVTAHSRYDAPSRSAEHASDGTSAESGLSERASSGNPRDPSRRSDAQEWSGTPSPASGSSTRSRASVAVDVTLTAAPATTCAFTGAWAIASTSVDGSNPSPPMFRGHQSTS